MYNIGNFTQEKEPKDPPLIIKFLKKMKSSNALKMLPSARRKEIALHKAKKRLEATTLEDRILGDNSRVKDFLKDKRLNGPK